MNLGKRLGITDDILKAATEVLEGKKISHPNQKEISTAAPPHDEITAADFKALKAKKKMHRVEGFDRNKKRYESPLFETYEEALAFFTKLRKTAPLTNLDIVQIDEISKPTVASYMTKVASQPPEKQKPTRDMGLELASKKLNRPSKVKVPATEEVEQIDELERSTMASYVDKADKDRIKRQRETPVAKRDAKFYNKNDSRLTGINRAVDKLNKEEVELVDESKELNKKNSDDEREHDCAKHVVHEQWGVGETVPTMHAEPDAEGNIAWYDVMFEHGIEQQVPTSALEITLSETHVHKKSKRMTEAEEHGKKKAPKKGETQVEFNPEYKKEEVEAVDEMDKSMAYATGTKRAMQMTGDEPPLEKSTIKKAHKIAKAMLRKEDVEQIDEVFYTVRGHGTGSIVGSPTKFIGSAISKALDHTKAGRKVTVKSHDHEHGHIDSVTINPGDHVKKAIEGLKKVRETVKEEVDTLDEGRKAGVVGSVLSNPAAREHFKKLTGKEPSYFHISKNPDHAQAALAHAAKAKAPEGEKPAEAGDEDTEANKHPINQLRGIADRGKGKFMGKDITRAHANKLISMHDNLKPAQKLDFVSNIGKHLSKVMS